MIATTIISSIRVKPFWFFIWYIPKIVVVGFSAQVTSQRCRLSGSCTLRVDQRRLRANPGTPPPGFPRAHDGSNFVDGNPPYPNLRWTRQCDAVRHLWSAAGTKLHSGPPGNCPDGSEPATIGNWMPVWGWRAGEPTCLSVAVRSRRNRWRAPPWSCSRLSGRGPTSGA
ncbi:hypothetical protein D3C72_1600180 [compost metagenome]